MSENITETTDADFEVDVLKSTMPVLVDFWAEWCKPCKMIMPVVEEIAAQYNGRLKVCKVNVDDNNATAVKYGVRGIPSLLIFKGGNVAAIKVGVVTQSQLVEFVDANI